MRTLFPTICILLATLLVLTPAQADAAQGKRYYKNASTRSDALAIVTGPRTGTYIAFGEDIAKVAKESGINVEVRASEGSIDNIKRIASTENAALGIVQSDVLSFLARSKNPDSMRIAQRLRMVFPFYREEVHVLARKNITDISQLNGKRVIVGPEGSGSLITSVNILSILNVTPARTLQYPGPEAVVAVLKNEADAMIFVGGKPVKLFDNLESLSQRKDSGYASLLNQVHFLPLNQPSLLQEYARAEITPQDYSFVDKAIPTVAVTAMLVDFDYNTDQANNAYFKHQCQQLSKLGMVMRDKLPSLQAGAHPKWKEVNFDQPVGSWKKDVCAWQKPPIAPEVSGALEKDLLGIIKGLRQPDGAAPAR